MNGSACPPRWAERLLARLLDERNRETVVGDLHEEFVESALPTMGLNRARLWYVRQASSFIPHSAKEDTPMKKLLMLVSLFSLICAGWLCLMEALLRHPGFGQRFAIDAFVSAIGAATILSRVLHASFATERWLKFSAPVVIYIGAQAFIHNARSAHFEGFVFIISLLLIIQGALMLTTLGGIRPRFSAR